MKWKSGSISTLISLIRIYGVSLTVKQGIFPKRSAIGILKCCNYKVLTYGMCLGVICLSIDCGKPYIFIKNTIPAVADEMGLEIRKRGSAPCRKRRIWHEP